MAYKNKDDNNYYNTYSSSNIPRKKDSNQHSDHDINNNNDNQPQARLVVVDDDPDIVHVLKLGLLKKGFLVDAFTNPEEALRNFKSNAKGVCIVVSDMRMPGLSGIQLARKVKEVNPDVKVVLMTAFEIRDNEFSKVFPSTHVDGFIQKPIGIAELTNKLLSLIGQTKTRLDED